MMISSRCGSFAVTQERLADSGYSGNRQFVMSEGLRGVRPRQSCRYFSAAVKRYTVSDS